MFSRYSKIKVPQNYSGNRFNIDEPEMKIHTPATQFSVKNAHSPTFSASMEDTSIKEDEYLSEVENDYEDFEEEQIDTYEDQEVIDTPTDVSPKSEEKRGFDISYLKNLISNINSEELLILGIILLIASDKDSSNDSLIWMLALLLLGKE
ncbi:MAG: hypothetical protein IJZ93_02515 [Clostridia bacterium]|nr:hypothetical protein [Clostridia bacterium]